MSDLALSNMFDSFVNGYFIAENIQVCVTNDGRLYLKATLKNNELGAIDARKWDYIGAPLTEKDNGTVVKVSGIFTEYKGRTQIKIYGLSIAEKGEYDIRSLVPYAPIDIGETAKYVSNCLNSIEDADYRNMVLCVYYRMNEQIKSIPAAMKKHHAFVGGLLMHTSAMLRAAEALYTIYKGEINRSLLLAGVFLHDVGKTEEFIIDKGGLVSNYSKRGKMLGHSVIGVMQIEKIAEEYNVNEEKKLLLEHLILTHHGRLEYGAAVRPVCAEAELLSVIDSMDCRMEMYRETEENVQEGQFSGYDINLKECVYNTVKE